MRFLLLTGRIMKLSRQKLSQTGKLQAMIPGEDHLMTIGDKGVAFFGGSGEAGHAIQTSAVQSSFWNETHCFLFTDRQSHAIDLKSRQVVASLPFSPNEQIDFFFSADGRSMLLIKNQSQMMFYSNTPTQ